ncbi:MAG: hypothetical protein ACK5JQ_05145, partial [Bacteroidota bacterium]
PFFNVPIVQCANLTIAKEELRFMGRAMLVPMQYDMIMVGNYTSLIILEDWQNDDVLWFKLLKILFKDML